MYTFEYKEALFLFFLIYLFEECSFKTGNGFAGVHMKTRKRRFRFETTTKWPKVLTTVRSLTDVRLLTTDAQPGLTHKRRASFKLERAFETSSGAKRDAPASPPYSVCVTRFDVEHNVL